MRVYAECCGLYSRAMVRISNALKRYAPPYVQFVDNEEQADLVVMYVIGLDYIGRATKLLAAGRRFAAVQCCVRTTELTAESEWHDFWRQADLVWSYLDLRESARTAGFNFMYAPLGLDDAFVEPPAFTVPRRNLIVTSGYVTGDSAESIYEVWEAADRLNIEAIHVGPSTVEGMKPPRNWQAVQPKDTELARLYRSARWVSGLRRKEGFELPAAEGAACGAIPFVFGQPSQLEWYRDLAVFVPECGGDNLVKLLHLAFKMPFHNDNEAAMRIARERFNWEHIVTQFWQQLEVGKEGKQAGTKEIAYAG